MCCDESKDWEDDSSINWMMGERCPKGEEVTLRVFSVNNA